MFGKFKTFDQIVAPLATMRDELNQLIRRNNEVNERNLQEMERLAQINEELVAENNMGLNGLQKLDEFFGVK